MPYPDHALKRAKRPAMIDPGIPIGAVRVTEKFRLFGALIGLVFHALWFDRNHEIVPD